MVRRQSDEGAHVDDDAVYAAARGILDTGLAWDGSLFTPAVEIWSADAAEASLTALHSST
jgi:hypothetical protein